jgi:hypothetical protein
LADSQDKVFLQRLGRFLRDNPRLSAGIHDATEFRTPDLRGFSTLIPVSENGISGNLISMMQAIYEPIRGA